MHSIELFILHIFGLDTQNGTPYMFWSGVGPVLFGQLPILIGIIVTARHKNCHVKGCWRLGHPDPAHGWPACKRHHSMGDLVK